MNPSDATISTLTNNIIKNPTLDNAQFWLIYGGLFVAFLVVTTVLTAYFLERGKLLAATDNLAGRLNDIRQTTEASERVRTEIAHRDWTVKELKTLRRNKLESLTTATFQLMAAMQIDAKLPDADSKFDFLSQTPLIELEQIALLYFPEFEAEALAISKAHNNFCVWVITNGSKIRQQLVLLKYLKVSREELVLAIPRDTDALAGNTAARQQSSAELSRLQGVYVEGYAPLREALGVTATALQNRAKALMASLIEPTV